MNLLSLWLILFGAYLTGQVLVVLLLTSHLDLRYSAFAGTVLTAPVQTAVVWLFLRGQRQRLFLDAMTSLGNTFRTTPLLLGMLVLELFLLVAGSLPRTWERMDLAASHSIPQLYAGLRSLSGGVLLLWQVSRRQGLDPARPWMIVVGLGMLLLGLEYFVPWLSAMPAVLFSDWTPFYGALFTYGGLVVVALICLSRLAAQLERRSAVSAALVTCAAGMFWAGSLVVILGRFRLAFPPYPWPQLSAASAYLAIGLLWLSVIFLWTEKETG